MVCLFGLHLRVLPVLLSLYSIACFLHFQLRATTAQMAWFKVAFVICSCKWIVEFSRCFILFKCLRIHTNFKMLSFTDILLDALSLFGLAILGHPLLMATGVEAASPVLFVNSSIPIVTTVNSKLVIGLIVFAVFLAMAFLYTFVRYVLDIGKQASEMDTDSNL